VARPEKRVRGPGRVSGAQDGLGRGLDPGDERVRVAGGVVRIDSCPLSESEMDAAANT